MALCMCHSIVFGPFCYAETDCTECLNGGTFQGDSCECPMGFNGTYCEVEGVLIYSLLPCEFLIRMHSTFHLVHVLQILHHMSLVTVPATMATVTTPAAHASAILSTLESTATKLSVSIGDEQITGYSCAPVTRMAVISVDLACILQSHHVETTTALMVVSVWKKMETAYASVKTHSMANTVCTTQNVSDFKA